MLLSPVVREREERETVNLVMQGMDVGGNFGAGIKKEESNKLPKRRPTCKPVGAKERAIGKVKEEEGSEKKAWERKGRGGNDDDNCE